MNVGVAGAAPILLPWRTARVAAGVSAGVAAGVAEVAAGVAARIAAGAAAGVAASAGSMSPACKRVSPCMGREQGPTATT